MITNDGATILKQMQVLHPAARMVCIITCYYQRWGRYFYKVTSY